MAFLLDTNVVSESRRANPNQHVRAWLGSVSGTELHISVLVVGEVRQGIERLRKRDSRQAERYEAWLESLNRDYRDRILPITPDIAEEWGRLNAPNPVAPVDGLMAATARVHHLILVTRNTTHVGRTGVPLLNPFEPLRARRS